MFQPDALPEPLVGVLAAVRAWGDTELGAPTSPEERAAWVTGLRQLVDAAEAVYLQSAGRLRHPR